MNTLDTKEKSDADVQCKFWTIKTHFLTKEADKDHIFGAHAATQENH